MAATPQLLESLADSFYKDHITPLTEQNNAGYLLADMFVNLMKVLKTCIHYMETSNPPPETIPVGTVSVLVKKENAQAIHDQCHGHLQNILANPFFKLYIYSAMKKRRRQRKQTLEQLDEFLRKLRQKCNISEKKP